jgi:hypothetical protein
MKFIFPPLMLLLIASVSSCTNDSATDLKNEVNAQTPISGKKNLNISVFIDLSDRISPEKYPMPGMEIYQRDLGYIQSISKAFEDHVKKSKIRQVDDYIQVFFEPEPMNSEINTLANNMKMSFARNDISKESIATIGPVYNQGSTKIYQLALKDKQFIGSDIWSFFKNKVKDYCIKPNHRNLLVILTDGYIYHKDNVIHMGNRTTYLTSELISAARLNEPRYAELIGEKKFGFIPATDGLDDLEVLVLGIQPARGKKFEEDVINKYWTDWLTGMGVKKYYLKGADLPSNMDPMIRDIIKNSYKAE